MAQPSGKLKTCIDACNDCIEASNACLAAGNGPVPAGRALKAAARWRRDRRIVQKNNSPTMTRGELADRAGVNRETVRYYEQRGLIPDPPRSKGDFRTYDESYVERLGFIKRAQELGFTLEEITELMELRLDPNGDCSKVRAKSTNKLADVREKIRDLQRIEDVLGRLAEACSGGGPTSECPILDAMQNGTS